MSFAKVGVKISPMIERSDVSGYRPLHLAAWQGNANVVPELLKKGGNANCQ